MSEVIELPECGDLKYWSRVNPSEIGLRTAILLSKLVGGSHHLPQDVMAKVDWSNPRFIEVRMPMTYLGGDLATFDFDGLTQLVFLAHDACIRVSIRPISGMNIRMMFHAREREGPMSQRHPTLEEAVGIWRHVNPIGGKP